MESARSARLKDRAIAAYAATDKKVKASTGKTIGEG